MAHKHGDFSTFDDIDIADSIQPPPSALTAKVAPTVSSSASTAYDPHASPSPLEADFPAAGARIGHQRTLTDTWFDNCQPFLNRATSTIQQHTSRASLHSPTKSLASFIPSRSTIESSTSQPKIKAGAKALQNWFNGSSAAVNLGVAPKHETDDEYDSEEEEVAGEHGNMMNIFNRGPALTRPATTETTPTQSPQSKAKQAPTSSKFSWLLNTQKSTSNQDSRPPVYHNPSDELLNLNISQALFPHGPVDSLDPHAFHDLLSNAESLLARFQNSYRDLSASLSDAQAEQSAQDDELDEAETRNRHLKMQLETMAARASEQDAQMRRLMDELAYERHARQEEEAARKRSLALIRDSGNPGYPVEISGSDLPRRRNRTSNSDVSIDSGFESECDSESASIFSRTNCKSPTDTIPSSVASFTEVDVTPTSKRPQPIERRSTYDRVRDGSVNLTQQGWGCSNCEGGAQSAVWGRLAKEREESRLLRKRVEYLEEAVDSALNVVDGPWGL
ncbi:hypothetical protein BU24DRAFT_435130 [Aaosphaeria arxii CBS 175.79]|uniref:Uncharacterized protein n=1 Tax=Aaosphaeria arxii CBS 175.79 TaxID=1450172 RepID=A0A6A5XIQ5_9PLEO|nr:uncharacterized protein BU24DRAFT_435130 [Aaosphaeria arxii CBS 175.79]KAF2012739.1 hypothetical protein BU24DRAFT_435130 [Aaosphaeria arxii CBS 175.79]